MSYVDPWANPLLIMVKLRQDVEAVLAEHPGADPARAGLHHITLLPAGRMQRTRIRSLRAALDRFHAPAFRVCFDIVHGTGERIIANGSDRMEGAIRFQCALRRHLIRSGLDLPAYAFKPHITLNYRSKRRGSAAIDAVSWLVDDFSLIESVHSRNRHEEYGRWALEPRFA